MYQLNALRPVVEMRFRPRVRSLDAYCRSLDFGRIMRTVAEFQVVRTECQKPGKTSRYMWLTIAWNVHYHWILSIWWVPNNLDRGIDLQSGRTRVPFEAMAVCYSHGTIFVGNRVIAATWRVQVSLYDTAERKADSSIVCALCQNYVCSSLVVAWLRAPGQFVSSVCPRGVVPVALESCTHVSCPCKEHIGRKQSSEKWCRSES